MKKQPNQLRRLKSLTEQAIDEIRTRIVRGEFELGAPLSENSLADALGVSKTPVREALLQLKSEGLVSVQPQRGTFVFDMSSTELLELGELRETLETTALRLASARARSKLTRDLNGLVADMQRAIDRDDAARYRSLDADFHEAMFRHSGNRYLMASYLGIAFRIQALRMRLSADPALNRSSYDDHTKLSRLVNEGQIDDALALLTKHVRTTVNDFVATNERRRLGKAS